MDASDLRVFEMVARLGSMSRAANELHTVQSNVTARIKALEEEIGAPLFERHSRGVVLAPAGRRLLPFAARVAHLLSDARRAARDDGHPSGPLAIGSLESTAALRLSPILARYAADYPEVDITLQTGTTMELVDKVLRNEVEGAFVCGPVNHPDLEEMTVFGEELVILTAPTVHRIEALLHRPQVKIIVLRAGCSYRQKLEGILAERGIVGLRRLEFGTLESIISCVSAGLGLTLLPRGLIGAVWREGKVAVHELPADVAKVDTVFIRRRDAFASSALTCFVDCATGQLATQCAAE